MTMIVSNILLYGLADTLAQTLSAILAFTPDQSHGVRFVWERAVQSVSLGESASDDEEDEEGLVELGLADDDFNFGQGDGASQARRMLRTSSSTVQDYKSYDFRRLSLFMVWGVVQAFLQYGWYAILNDVYSEDNLFLSALKRVLSDQLCYSPLCKSTLHFTTQQSSNIILALAAFFVYTTIVIDRGDLDSVNAKLRAKYLPTLVVNYAVWPLTQFINFLLLPRALQVPFASTDKYSPIFVF